MPASWPKAFAALEASKNGEIRNVAAALAVTVGDSEALAGAISQLLHDEELRLRLAGEAQRRALAQDADYTAQCFRALYARCGARRG